MKLKLDNHLQTQIFPTIDEWRAFAASCGAPSTFYGGASAPQFAQSVHVSVLMLEVGCAALAPVFQTTNECGLWVAPQWRNQKLGVRVLQHALGPRNARPNLATVSHDNPDRQWMTKILLRCGFTEHVSSAKLALWRRDAAAMPTTTVAPIS